MGTDVVAQEEAAWGSAPFERVAPTISDVHDVIVDRLPTRSKDWLDIGCGTGDLAFKAAQAGAKVTAIDFAPRLIETAKRQAKEHRLTVDFRIGRAERLPVDDESFDVVVSTFGLMFSPDQEAAAKELTRVTRQDGLIGLASWTEEGGDGDLFRLIARFQPPPPPHAANPFNWGRRTFVDAMLGDHFALTYEDQDSVLHISSGEAYWRLFSTNFGPLKSLIGTLSPSKAQDLHKTWVEWAEGMRQGDEIVHHREYLLTLGRRRLHR